MPGSSTGTNITWCFLFQVGWYNDQVGAKFELDYAYDTLAFIVISQPSMFEKGFLPFMKEQKYSGIRDPIDECMIYYFQQAKQVSSASFSAVSSISLMLAVFTKNLRGHSPFGLGLQAT